MSGLGARRGNQPSFSLACIEFFHLTWLARIAASSSSPTRSLCCRRIRVGANYFCRQTPLARFVLYRKGKQSLYGVAPDCLIPHNSTRTHLFRFCPYFLRRPFQPLLLLATVWSRSRLSFYLLRVTVTRPKFSPVRDMKEDVNHAVVEELLHPAAGRDHVRGHPPGLS